MESQFTDTRLLLTKYFSDPNGTLPYKVNFVLRSINGQLSTVYFNFSVRLTKPQTEGSMQRKITIYFKQETDSLCYARNKRTTTFGRGIRPLVLAQGFFSLIQSYIRLISLIEHEIKTFALLLTNYARDVYSKKSLNTDTRMIWTLLRVPWVSVLTGYHCV